MSNIAPSADSPSSAGSGVDLPETVSPSAGKGDADGRRPEDAQGRSKRRWKLTHRVTTVIVLVVMVGAGVTSSLFAYHRRAAVHRSMGSVSASSDVRFNEKHQPTVPIIDITANVVSVAPESQTAKIRLVFGYWQENSLTDSPYSPQRLTVTILGTLTNPNDYTSPTANSYTFDAGQQMRPIDVDMSFAETSTQKYPFDRYTGFLVFNASDTSGKIVQSSITNFTDLADGWKISLDSNLCDITGATWYPFLSGFGPNTPDCATGVEAQTPATGYQGLKISIQREPVPKIYAIFILILLWTLALSGVVTVLTVLRNKDEYDFALPTYLAALLFAFPLIRGLLPGNPALGVLADFAAYFWVEAAIGVSLLVLVVVWVKRSRHHLEGRSEGARARSDLSP